MTINTTSLAGGLFAAAMILPASAHAATFTADLIELNNSGVSGSVVFELDDDMSTLDVTADIMGLSNNPDGPNLHVNHIHGLFNDDGSAAESQTPTLDPDADPERFTLVEDSNGDGLIQVLEGVPAYGDVLLSLEKPNPTPESNHNGPIDDDGDGEISYSYSYELTDELIFSTVTGNEYNVGDLFPLALREYVIHGGFDSEGVWQATLPQASAELAPMDMTTPVPIPAAGVLMLAGLGGLGIAARRKR